MKHRDATFAYGVSGWAGLDDDYRFEAGQPQTGRRIVHWLPPNSGSGGDPYEARPGGKVAA